MYDVLSWGLDEDEDASHFWLVVHNGIIQGWACLSPDCDRKGKLIWPLDVYVGVKYRRQGVGRDLLHRALTYSKRNKLSVVVNPWNHTSKKFYLPIKDQVTWDRRCLPHHEGKWK
jgi:GNAT superfamily N-acetyltransferase